MNTNRRKVLEMLSCGQITTEEADRLISALESNSSESSPSDSSESRPKGKTKNLRIVAGLYYLRGRGLGFWDQPSDDQIEPQSDRKKP